MYEISLIFSVLCFLGVCGAFARSPAFSLFHPLTWYLTFHGFVFVMRPILAYVQSFDLIYKIYEFTPSIQDKSTAIYASSLGLISFAIGSLYRANKKLIFKNDDIFEIEKKRASAVFITVAMLLLPIAIYSINKSWNTAVTTGSAYSDMIQVSRGGLMINNKSNGYLMDAQLMLVPITAIFAWIFRFRLIALIPLVLFAVFRSGTGGRGPVIAAFACAALLYLYDRRRYFPSTPILTMVPLLLIAFTAVGDDRGAAIRRLLSNDASSAIFGPYRTNERMFEGMDFGNLEYLEYVIYVVPQRSGTYAYFNDLLQVFTEPVPRLLWKDKPIGAPFQRINFLDYGNNVGMTLSLPGEGWYSLGWAGVVIWCGAVGWATGSIYRRFVEGGQSIFAMIGYVVFLSTLILGFRDGQLVSILRQSLFYMLPVVLWWAATRLLGQPSAVELRTGIRHRRYLLLQSQSANSYAASTNSSNALPAAVQRRRLALMRLRRDR